jgi:hypothetical protein
MRLRRFKKIHGFDPIFIIKIYQESSFEFPSK